MAVGAGRKLALLLEAMQDEHGFLELDRVDGAVRAARVVFDHLQDPRSNARRQSGAITRGGLRLDRWRARSAPLSAHQN